MGIFNRRQEKLNETFEDFMATSASTHAEIYKALTAAKDVLGALVDRVEALESSCGCQKKTRNIRVDQKKSKPQKIKVTKTPKAKNATVVCASKKALDSAIMRKASRGYILLRSWKDKSDGKYKATFEKL